MTNLLTYNKVLIPVVVVALLATTCLVLGLVTQPAAVQGIIHANGGHHGGGSGDGSSDNGHGAHRSQSQSTAQANICGNDNGASDITCQNLSNQIYGNGNAVNVIGAQSGGGGSGSGNNGGGGSGSGNNGGGGSGSGNNGGGGHRGSTDPSISIPTTASQSQACHTAGLSSAKSNSCNGTFNNNVTNSGGLLNRGRT
ncbi:MAG TPA: hypothetical protein VH796_10115 [Nitrososphaeraceae archaeon]